MQFFGIICGIISLIAFMFPAFVGYFMGVVFLLLALVGFLGIFLLKKFLATKMELFRKKISWGDYEIIRKK